MAVQGAEQEADVIRVAGVHGEMKKRDDDVVPVETKLRKESADLIWGNPLAKENCKRPTRTTY